MQARTAIPVREQRRLHRLKGLRRFIRILCLKCGLEELECTVVTFRLRLHVAHEVARDGQAAAGGHEEERGDG